MEILLCCYLCIDKQKVQFMQFWFKINFVVIHVLFYGEKRQIWGMREYMLVVTINLKNDIWIWTGSQHFHSSLVTPGWAPNILSAGKMIISRGNLTQDTRQGHWTFWPDKNCIWDGQLLMFNVVSHVAIDKCWPITVVEGPNWMEKVHTYNKLLGNYIQNMDRIFSCSNVWMLKVSD